MKIDMTPEKLELLRAKLQTASENPKFKTTREQTRRVRQQEKLKAKRIASQ